MINNKQQGNKAVSLLSASLFSVLCSLLSAEILRTIQTGTEHTNVTDRREVTQVSPVSNEGAETRRCFEEHRTDAEAREREAAARAVGLVTGLNEREGGLRFAGGADYRLIASRGTRAATPSASSSSLFSLLLSSVLCTL